MRLFQILTPVLLLLVAGCGGESSPGPSGGGGGGGAGGAAGGAGGAAGGAGGGPTEPPTVCSTVPEDVARGIATNLPLSATFSREMAAETVTADTFLLMHGEIAVPGDVSYAGRIARFTPAGLLPAGAELTATITTGSTDPEGVALAAAYSWSFGTLPEGSLPGITGTNPGSEAIAVPVGQAITATFNQAMDPTSLSIRTFTVQQGGTAVVGAVFYEASSNTVTFSPAAPLALEARYTATIFPEARGIAGLALAEAYAWSFTTEAPPLPPEVTGTSPADGAVAVPASTLTDLTFTLQQNGAAVPGIVSYDAASNTATFAPTVPLGASLLHTATVFAGTMSAAGLALELDHSWSFTTRAPPPLTLPVDLLSAGNYVILAETGISTVPASAITGDIAISPSAATFLTGFSLTADPSNTFSTSTQVTGSVYAADYTPPTPNALTVAVIDMGTAFTEAAGRAADVTELGAGNIGGMTLPPGVYKWGTGLLIPTDVHLSGSATDVWIFQIAQDLTVASATSVFLAGGALPKNVFWQVSGLVDLNTTSHLEGVILCQTAITLRTGASVNGRLLAQSAVALDSSVIVEPAP